MAELAETLAPADDDERLDQAESVVRDHCGWHIAPSRTDTVRIYGAPLGTPILLPSMYVTGIVSVTDQGTLVDPTLYDFEQAGILRRTDGGCWASGYGAIEVEFIHGYASVPPAVTRVVQSVAALLPNGLKSKQAGPFSESYFDDLPQLDKVALSRYRIPVGP
jgi:hypothetical protein